jgi:LacI family transcriptional regulator
VFCVHDFLGGTVLRVCQHLGIPVPDKVAVLGVDNDEVFCESNTPALSSIEWPMANVGFKAARVLDRMLRGRPAPKRAITVPPAGVHVRQSTEVLAVEDPLVARALHFIREHACRPIRLGDVVKRVSHSRRALGMRFRKSTGRTIFQEIRHVQILRVQELLRETQMTVEQVACATGFEDGKTLARAYRAATGATPTEYRSEFREW